MSATHTTLLERLNLFVRSMAGTQADVICNVGAARVAREFEGSVELSFSKFINTRQGLISMEETAIGHHFVVIGDFLVDWWAFKNNLIPQPVLSIDDELIQLYGSPILWEVVR